MGVLNRYVREWINKPKKGRLEDFCSTYGPPYYVDLKLDGERVLLFKLEDGSALFANAYNTTYHPSFYRRVASQVEGLEAETVVLDGELVSSERGDIYRLLSDRARNLDKLKIYFFDILELNGEDTRLLSLTERRRLLEEIGASPTVETTLAHSVGEVEELFERAVERGYEGVVVKPDAPYSAWWLKLKKLETVDAAVLGVKKTPDLDEGVARSFLIGFYHPETKSFKPYGYVSSGLSEEEKRAIYQLLPDMERGEDGEVIYVEPIIVLEVAYQQKMENGFRHPRILRLRLDKPPEECLPP